MGARWYAPQWASFISRDTLSGELKTPVSLNRYTYANGNPMVFFDPDGREPVCHPLCGQAEREEERQRPSVPRTPNCHPLCGQAEREEADRGPSRPRSGDDHERDTKAKNDHKAKNRNRDRDAERLERQRAERLSRLSIAQQEQRERARDIRRRLKQNPSPGERRRLEVELRAIRNEFNGNKSEIVSILEDSAEDGVVPDLDGVLDNATANDIRRDGGLVGSDRAVDLIEISVELGPEFFDSQRGDLNLSGFEEFAEGPVGDAALELHDHRAGILEGVSYGAAGAGVVLAPVSGGASLGLTAVAIGAGTASEAVDPKQCRGERVGARATLGIFSAGTGGAFSAGGAPAGDALTQGATTGLGLDFENC